ncbi:helix-turn-helix domain-containing protein [Ekhidna sp.]
MISLITSSKAQKIIAENMRSLRLKKGLTQEGLSERSGVSLPTLRKFEQKGLISLESFLKISLILDSLESIIDATKPTEKEFSSIDDVVNNKNKNERKRGWKK